VNTVPGSEKEDLVPKKKGFNFRKKKNFSAEKKSHHQEHPDNFVENCFLICPNTSAVDNF
jgi:hypothetical protein